MNKLIISGRLTRDAEVRFIPSGTPVMSFSVANNTGFGDNQKTHFFDWSIFFCPIKIRPRRLYKKTILGLLLISFFVRSSAFEKFPDL